MIVNFDCTKEVDVEKLLVVAQTRLVVVHAPRRAHKSHLAQVLCEQLKCPWVVATSGLRNYWQGRFGHRIKQILAWVDLVHKPYLVLGHPFIVYDGTEDPRINRLSATGVWLTDGFWEAFQELEYHTELILDGTASLRHVADSKNGRDISFAEYLTDKLETMMRIKTDDDEWRSAVPDPVPGAVHAEARAGSAELLQPGRGTACVEGASLR